MGNIKAKKEIVYTCNAFQTSLNMKFSNFLSDNFDYSTDSPEVRKIYPKTYFPLAGSIDITFREVMVEVLVHYTYAMPHLKFIENPEIHKKEYKFVKFKKDETDIDNYSYEVIGLFDIPINLFDDKYKDLDAFYSDEFINYIMHRIKEHLIHNVNFEKFLNLYFSRRFIFNEDNCRNDFIDNLIFDAKKQDVLKFVKDLPFDKIEEDSFYLHEITQKLNPYFKNKKNVLTQYKDEHVKMMKILMMIGDSYVRN